MWYLPSKYICIYLSRNKVLIKFKEILRRIFLALEDRPTLKPGNSDFWIQTLDTDSTE